MTVGQDGVVAGRPQLMRAMNEETILNALRKSGPLMRTDLTRLSGLSKPTVGLALVNLEGNGLVRVAGRRTGARGPAALIYEVNPEAGFVLALDVGSEYVRGALADLSGAVRARGNRSVHGARTEVRMSELIGLAEGLVGSGAIERSDVTVTVVGSPGVYDRSRDALSLALGLPGWESPGVIAELRRALGDSTIVHNDINLAALAERDNGHGRDVDTFAFVSVGTGVGLGLVLGGELHTGVHGAAGEIGFLPLGWEGVNTTDARRRGALEAAASAAGVVRAARRLGMTGRLSARRIFDAAVAGDERAMRVVAGEARLVAQAVASVVSVVDPALVVLGGGIGCAPGFAELVAAELARIVPIAPEIRVSALGGEAIVEGGLVAGIGSAWRRVLDCGS
jgi:predicted NBD/HSP70 family sugar kinase